MGYYDLSISIGLIWCCRANSSIFVAFSFSILLLLDVTLWTCMCTQQIYESSRNVKIEKTSSPIQDNRNLAQYEKTAEDEGQTWQAGPGRMGG